MITYVYWLLVGAVIVAALYWVGVRAERMRPALIIAAVVLVAGTLTYYFWLQQIFVKRWGGHMSITVPAGQEHIMATWKDDNLWVENFDPRTNSCIFSEYSRGNLLQGQVVIKNCNPIASSPQ